MHRKTIKTNYLQTIDWFNKMVVDWNSAGTAYSMNGKSTELQKYHFGFECDGSITSACGQYAFIYQKLGTKGLLLKDGELLREINRSYYQSSVYEFPAAFFTFRDRTYLAHCPYSYCQLDFEEVETGEILTNRKDRNPSDIFHSRLEVSPDNKFFLSKGWVWHPLNVIELFDIEQCFLDPTQLDSQNGVPGVHAEICSASFIDNDRILLCTSDDESDDDPSNLIPDGHTGIWNFKENKIGQVVKPEIPLGNVFAIDDHYCWDLFDYPKLVDITTGKILDKVEDIDCGKQNSSIIHHLKNLPKIAFNKTTGKIAIAGENKIEILGK